MLMVYYLLSILIFFKARGAGSAPLSIRLEDKLERSAD